MRPEHAAVHVSLVDDDVAQVVQHVGPQVVARQDPDVEHVRVREHEVRPHAHVAALLLRRVAVVDRGMHSGNGKRRERARLVLRERLRRVEVERPVLRRARERVEDGEVERECLARRGPRRDDRVLSAGRRLPRFGLVVVELGDAAPLERCSYGRVQLLRERRRARGARRLGDDVGELFAPEQVIPQRSRPR